MLFIGRYQVRFFVEDEEAARCSTRVCAMRGGDEEVQRVRVTREIRDACSEVIAEMDMLLRLGEQAIFEGTNRK